MKKILIIGGVSYDTIAQVDSFPQPTPHTVFASDSYTMTGSTGTGKAVQFAHLGFATTFHYIEGNDEFGPLITRDLASHGIRCIPFKDKECGSERHFNLMDKKGDRISIYTGYASFDPQIDPASLIHEIESHDIIAVNIKNYARRFIPHIKEAGKEYWCDIHDYNGEDDYHKDFIEGASYIQLSADRLANYRSFMEDLIADGKKLVICTRGSKGSCVLTASGEYVEQGIIEDRYPFKDTNGAGDSYFAGFVYGYEKTHNIQTAARYGALASALTISVPGMVFPLLSPDYLDSEYTDLYGDQ